jgi:hypothetical protein
MWSTRTPCTTNAIRPNCLHSAYYNVNTTLEFTAVTFTNPSFVGSVSDTGCCGYQCELPSTPPHGCREYVMFRSRTNPYGSSTPLRASISGNEPRLSSTLRATNVPSNAGCTETFASALDVDAATRTVPGIAVGNNGRASVRSPLTVCAASEKEGTWKSGARSATEALIGLQTDQISTSTARRSYAAGLVDARIVGLHRERCSLDALFEVMQVNLGIDGASRAEKRRLAGDDAPTHSDRGVRRREPHHARVNGIDHDRPIRRVNPHPVEKAVLI